MTINQAEAKLLYHSPIGLVARAVRMCTDSLSSLDTSLEDESFGPKDEKLIKRRILKVGEAYDPLNPSHESTLEHAIYTFELNFSRSVLQELSRHRIASPSVQSSRYALKKIIKKIDKTNLHLFLTFTGDKEIDQANIDHLNVLIGLVKSGKPNDKVKYAIVDAFRTQAILTINARSLRNLFRLRTSSHALWEFRQLAFAMVDAIPEGHKVLFADRIHERPTELLER